MKQIFPWAVLGILLATGAGRSEQDPKPPRIRAEVEVVQVVATVEDRRGNLRTDLRKEDFEVSEDGVSQEIRHFLSPNAEGKRPLAVLLMMDTSGSVQPELDFIKEGAVKFLASALDPAQDVAAVLQFDSVVELVHDFTHDQERLENSMRSIRGGGATKLYDAVWLGSRELLAEEFGRRVMVILSDGADTQSLVSNRDALREAQARDVVIFGVGIRTGGFASDFRGLRRFSRETGGEFYNSRLDRDELSEAFENIRERIHNQYAFGYVSSNPNRDGSFRKIRVRVRERGLNVRHRQGYYAGGESP